MSSPQTPLIISLIMPTKAFNILYVLGYNIIDAKSTYRSRVLIGCFWTEVQKYKLLAKLRFSMI